MMEYIEHRKSMELFHKYEIDHAKFKDPKNW